jgi:hypothetical protein
MKLIAIETATGKQFPVREAGETWILVQTGKQSYVYEKAGERYTLHVSTCMFDKHGREILVGDEVITKLGENTQIVFNGDCFVFMPGGYDEAWFDELTPEIAETIEVVE